MLIPFDTPDAFLGDSSRTAVLSIADAGGGRLDCSMWFGVGSIIQAARDGDDYVCRVLGELTDQYGPGKDAPECTGQEPTASRSVQVLLDPARSSFGPALSFAWGPACTGNPAACGWWGLRVAAMDGLAGAVRPPALPGVSKKSDATQVRLHARPAGLAGLLGSRRPRPRHAQRPHEHRAISGKSVAAAPSPHRAPAANAYDPAPRKAGPRS